MILEQHPYIDENGRVFENLIKTYSSEENKGILQLETGYIYIEAIDVFPCKYHYEEVELEKQEEESKGE